ncbi:hypothetical protein PLEOSDRAFT_1085421 [Pleurotus ostreatus PC15]|uniref:Heterokaryon incompatibility domain-containing protein n=1 Tax=Pleurotus ostreatus (strain PC15) TaxID=1137138 RepID=A0A067NRD3_PLEO1|nr:hypothetical protein PLEOSDRAFT_1085421 [Pleurotus ostreatus PC15]
MGTLSQHDAITTQGTGTLRYHEDTIQRDGSTALQDAFGGPVEQDDVFVQWLEMYSNWDIYAAVRLHVFNSQLKLTSMLIYTPGKHLVFQTETEKQSSRGLYDSEWQKEASSKDIERSKELLRPYISAAMLKNPMADGPTAFVLGVIDELRQFNLSLFPPTRSQRGHHSHSRFRRYSIKHRVLHELIAQKRTQTPMPTIREVREQIALFGQYAILSHRWSQNGQELSFADVLAGLSNRVVQEKEGYKKLMGFCTAVKSIYGCRYVWMDSVCISEDDRSASIPRMFSWYRQAYVCLIYFATSPKVAEDPWSTRGWTLQEFLAARRFRCFKHDWSPVILTQRKFHANREVERTVDDVYKRLQSVSGHLNWLGYKPGVGEVYPLFKAMRNRETTVPEDMVYALLAALDSDCGVEYGEGFDRAFFRLQAACLARGGERRLLLWDPSASAHPRPSPYNSMLAGDFTMFVPRPGDDQFRAPVELPDASISFDAHGAMRVMVTLHWPPSPGLWRAVTFPLDYVTGTVFALLQTDSHGEDGYGVLLRPGPPDTTKSPANNVPGGEGPDGEGQFWRKKRVVYERIQYFECKLSDIIPAYSSAEPEWVYIR